MALLLSGRLMRCVVEINNFKEVLKFGWMDPGLCGLE